MNSSDRIVKAKVKMQKDVPFFAYLVMNLKIIERKEIESMGVDNRGNCYYNSEFVESLSDDELKGVLTHEVMHIVLEHLIRGKNLEHQMIMNVACDMVVNDILVENNFSLPSCNGGSLIPYRHECSFSNITIEDINKKTALQIYHEIISQMKKQKKKGKGNKKDKNGQPQEDEDGEPKYEGFDKHMTTGDSKETNEQISKQKDQWKGALAEASMFAKQRGEIPRGMELMLDELLNPKVDWKTLLYRYITSVIPFDYTYCLEENTKIKTPRGEKAIKDLKQGRKVIGYKDGKAVYSTIKSKWKTETKEKYIFETESGKELICTPHHRILTERGYIQAQFITKSDRIICIK